MSFSIYALLNDSAPHLSIEAIAKELREYFRNEDDLTIDFEFLPFTNNKTVAMRWPAWMVRVAYEEGKVVQDDLETSNNILIGNGVTPIKTERRIRVVFGDDHDQVYTNQTVMIFEYLSEIPSAAIFNPETGKMIDI